MNCARMVVGRRGLNPGVAAAVAALLTACGSGAFPGATAQGTRIELQSPPAVSYDTATGKTTVALEFLVRDPSGASVDPATTTIRRYVDGIVDMEAVSATQDTKLSSNLRLGVVLDASYSMTQWQPPAFEPMKKAAYDMLESIRGQFSAGGSFTPFVSYFQDQYVCSAAPGAADGAVLTIPTPQQGSSTRLFAAAAHMVGTLKQAYAAIPTPAASDHFALVVFTDGYDNYSSFDASSTPSTTVGAFTCGGTPATQLQDLLSQVQAFPQLKVHVIGLGNQIKASELTAIASAGGGRLVTNPDPAQVATLFGEVTREFTTIRSDAITLPLTPGDHEYIEEVSLQGTVARLIFRFHTGDASAAVLPGSIRTQ